MSISHLPLSYCTNLHPGRTVEEVLRGLHDFTVPSQQEFGSPVAAGLWLAQPVTTELLATRDGVQTFAARLTDLGLQCYTLNAFPYGDFHSVRVKEQVYLPDWTQPSRREYTEACARILAELLPDGVEGSISTVPLGFKGFSHPPDFLDRCCGRGGGVRHFSPRVEEASGRVAFCLLPPVHIASSSSPTGMKFACPSALIAVRT